MAIVDSARAGRHAIELGATILQLRALDLTTRELEREAMELVPKSSVPVVMRVGLHPFQGVKTWQFSRFSRLRHNSC